MLFVTITFPSNITVLITEKIDPSLLENVVLPMKEAIHDARATTPDPALFSMIDIALLVNLPL